MKDVESREGNEEEIEKINEKKYIVYKCSLLNIKSNFTNIICYFFHDTAQCSKMC